MDPGIACTWGLCRPSDTHDTPGQSPCNSSQVCRLLMDLLMPAATQVGSPPILESLPHFRLSHSCRRGSPARHEHQAGRADIAFEPLRLHHPYRGICMEELRLLTLCRVGDYAELVRGRGGGLREPTRPTLRATGRWSDDGSTSLGRGTIKRTLRHGHISSSIAATVYSDGGDAPKRAAVAECRLEPPDAAVPLVAMDESRPAGRLTCWPSRCRGRRQGGPLPSSRGSRSRCATRARGPCP